MRDPIRDPFLRPGVADEIEAQLRMQEEKRLEAERLAKAEADIARLRSNVRRSLFAIAVVAIGMALVAAAFFADLFATRLASPEAPAPTPGPAGSALISPADLASSPKARLPLTTRKAEATMPEAAAPARIATDVINTAPASAPPIKVAPITPLSPLTPATPTAADAEDGKPVAPVFLSGVGSPSREYEIKAALLARFAQMVSRPPKASPAANEGFTIGILGSDALGDTLDKLLQGELIHGSKAAIRRSRDPADLHGAQMVFISKSEQARIGEILRSFAGTDTLTIGETNGFSAMGGMIEFTFVGNSIRFRVNRLAAQKAGLGINTNLLKLAVP
jgi:hypothetical protein